MKNSKKLRHDEYNIFFTFNGLFDFFDNADMCACMYAEAENNRMYTAMDCEAFTARMIRITCKMVMVMLIKIMLFSVVKMMLEKERRKIGLISLGN